MVAMLKKYNGKPVYARPGVPTSSGTIEGLNRVTKVNLYSELNRNGVLDKKVGNFIPALAKVTHAYNNTVSSSHGFIPAMINKPVDQLPAEVVKAVDTRLRSNAKQTQPNAKYQPFLSPGNLIRIEVGDLSNKIKQEQKAGSYKSSHQASFSNRVYVVKKQRADGFVEIMENNALYSRGSCLLVPAGSKSFSEPEKELVTIDKTIVPKKRKPQQTDYVLPTRVLRSQK
jgi:hypothetical protein